MRQKQLTPQQYVINNLVVAENYAFRFNPYVNYLNIIDKKDKFRIQAENNFQNELNIFKDKL
jgi:hypothetical protein